MPDREFAPANGLEATNDELRSSKTVPKSTAALSLALSIFPFGAPGGGGGGSGTAEEGVASSIRSTNVAGK